MHHATRLALALCVILWGQAGNAQGVLRLVEMLKSGRVPESRQAVFVDQIGKRGTTEDLGFLLEQCVATSGFSPTVRGEALRALEEAATVRKMLPSGALGRLVLLLREPSLSPQDRRNVMRLIGLARLEEGRRELECAMVELDRSEAERQAAADALVSLDGPASWEYFLRLSSPERPRAIRIAAGAALARLDGARALPKVMELLQGTDQPSEIGPLVNAYLGRQGGAKQLASAIAKSPPSADVARLMLRQIYSMGHDEPTLVAVLSKLAGLEEPIPLPQGQEMLDLVAEVLARGDPARGEEIFRRSDLSCMKCHAVAKAGGQVGPDLSAIGQTSPVDYVIKSLLAPDLDKKEQFLTRVFVSNDGRLFHGIVVDRNDDRVVIKDADGTLLAISAHDIDDEVEGRSLMPEGLVRLLTRQEFLDLVRFVSELGKPGPYAIRNVPTIQRWRVMIDPPREIVDAIPDDEAFRLLLLDAPPNAWKPAYAKVSGGLPLAELAGTGSSTIAIIFGELDVTTPGPVELRIHGPPQFQVWMDAQRLPDGSRQRCVLDAGRHRVTLRVAHDSPGPADITVEVLRPDGASTDFVVVGGS